MPNCVIRFGGNSVKDVLLLETFASLLKSTDEQHVVVVSAIPELLQITEKGLGLLINNAISADGLIDQITHELKRLPAIIGNKLERGNGQNEIEELRNLLRGIQFTGDYSAALKDQVICFSEQITSRLLLLFLEEQGLPTRILSPEEGGLKVTDEYGNGTALFEESVRPEQHFQEKVLLIPGSFGINSSGKINRLGIRSADYAAAAYSRLFEAPSLELWGIDQEFRTADDPRVENTTVIPRLTYAEASELAYFSDSSIHPRIVEPLIGKHIPIRVYKLEKNGKTLQTTINSESFITENVVKSVVHTDDIAILKLNGPGVGFKPGILAKVTSAFHQSEINIRSVITSQVSINIILNKNDIAKANEICRHLKLTSVSEIILNQQVSLIAVVGHGMQQYHGVSAKLFSAVANHQINVLLSGSGASDLVSYLIIAQKDKAKAIKAIHQTFFNVQ
jgi:aspartate kinase